MNNLFLLLIFLSISVVHSAISDKYCKNKNCYDILGVKK